MRVNPEDLAGHVSVLAEQFVPRSYDNSENLGKCADYIAEQFRASGGAVSRQPYDTASRTYENVIVTFAGRRDSRIVVGAHYDSCGDTPGADDNASGVAGLIELARLLGGASHEHTIELVAYCTEEPPFFASPNMGSAHHAARLKKQGVEVVAMMALEMIGYFTDEPRSQKYPFGLLYLFYPSRGNFLAIVGNMGQRPLARRVKRAMKGATDLPVYSALIPSVVPGVDFSDHRNYWAEGYPAVMITDTAFLRNPGYHGLDDTPDTLDYERMADVVVCVHEAVIALDE